MTDFPCVFQELSWIEILISRNSDSVMQRFQLGGHVLRKMLLRTTPAVGGWPVFRLSCSAQLSASINIIQRGRVIVISHEAGGVGTVRCRRREWSQGVITLQGRGGGSVREGRGLAARIAKLAVSM